VIFYLRIVYAMGGDHSKPQHHNMDFKRDMYEKLKCYYDNGNREVVVLKSTDHDRLSQLDGVCQLTIDNYDDDITISQLPNRVVISKYGQIDADGLKWLNKMDNAFAVVYDSGVMFTDSEMSIDDFNYLIVLQSKSEEIAPSAPPEPGEISPSYDSMTTTDSTTTTDECEPGSAPPPEEEVYYRIGKDDNDMHPHEQYRPYFRLGWMSVGFESLFQYHKNGGRDVLVMSDFAMNNGRYIANGFLKDNRDFIVLERRTVDGGYDWVLVPEGGSVELGHEKAGVKHEYVHNTYKGVHPYQVHGTNKKPTKSCYSVRLVLIDKPKPNAKTSKVWVRDGHPQSMV